MFPPEYPRFHSLIRAKIDPSVSVVTVRICGKSLTAVASLQDAKVRQVDDFIIVEVGLQTGFAAVVRGRRS